MDNIQFNHLNMFRAVSKHASKNQAITDTLPAFATGIVALNVKITAIGTTSGEQDLAITGVTESKNQLQETLVQSTFSVISPTKQHVISRLKHRTSGSKHRASYLKHKASGTKHRTSWVKHSP